MKNITIRIKKAFLIIVFLCFASEVKIDAAQSKEKRKESDLSLQVTKRAKKEEKREVKSIDFSKKHQQYMRFLNNISQNLLTFFQIMNRDFSKQMFHFCMSLKPDLPEALKQKEINKFFKENLEKKVTEYIVIIVDASWDTSFNLISKNYLIRFLTKFVIAKIIENTPSFLRPNDRYTTPGCLCKEAVISTRVAFISFVLDKVRTSFPISQDAPSVCTFFVSGSLFLEQLITSELLYAGYKIKNLNFIDLHYMQQDHVLPAATNFCKSLQKDKLIKGTYSELKALDFQNKNNRGWETAFVADDKDVASFNATLRFYFNAYDYIKHALHDAHAKSNMLILVDPGQKPLTYNKNLLKEYKNENKHLYSNINLLQITLDAGETKDIFNVYIPHYNPPHLFQLQNSHNDGIAQFMVKCVEKILKERKKDSGHFSLIKNISKYLEQKNVQSCIAKKLELSLSEISIKVNAFCDPYVVFLDLINKSLKTENSFACQTRKNNIESVNINQEISPYENNMYSENCTSFDEVFAAKYIFYGNSPYKLNLVHRFT